MLVIKKPVYSGNFSSNMRAEFGEICAKICRIYAAYIMHICGITEICGINDACAYTLDKMRRNAEKCNRICGNMRNMRLYVNFCKFMHK